MILRRNNDGYQGGLMNLIPSSVSARRKDFNRGMMATALQGILNSAPAALGSIRLSTGRAGGPVITHPAVIENFRDMRDPVGSFRSSQQQVVVLRALITRPEPTNGFQKASTEYREMRHVVHR